VPVEVVVLVVLREGAAPARAPWSSSTSSGVPARNEQGRRKRAVGLIAARFLLLFLILVIAAVAAIVVVVVVTAAAAAAVVLVLVLVLFSVRWLPHRKRRKTRGWPRKGQDKRGGRRRGGRRRRGNMAFLQACNRVRTSSRREWHGRGRG